MVQYTATFENDRREFATIQEAQQHIMNTAQWCRNNGVYRIFSTIDGLLWRVYDEKGKEVNTIILKEIEPEPKPAKPLKRFTGVSVASELYEFFVAVVDSLYNAGVWAFNDDNLRNFREHPQMIPFNILANEYTKEWVFENERTVEIITSYKAGNCVNKKLFEDSAKSAVSDFAAVALCIFPECLTACPQL